MSRTVSGGLAAHMAGASHKTTFMLRLDLFDGTAMGFSDHDVPLSFNLGDGAITYQVDTGIAPSDLSLATGFEGGEMEVAGPIDDALITRAALRGGRFDAAVVRFFLVNRSDLSQGAARLLKGRVVLAEEIGDRFKLTIHSEATKFAQTVGRLITAYCDADFGDARCGFTPATLLATVSGVTDEHAFAVTFAGTYANDFFNKGKVQFATGALAGTRPVEIFDFVGGTGSGSVTLWTGLAEAPAIGATLIFSQGCGKTRADCLAYGNVINFRGFPDVPGSDQVLRYPNPGGGG